jgi:histidine ammonia-lyase
VIELDGGELAPAAVAAVAREREAVRLSERGRQRNLRAREQIAALLAEGGRLYGASTGVGALRDRAVGEEEREALQWSLLRSHACAVGPPLPVEAVRAAMVVRANQLAAGGAGVAPELLERLIEALNRGLTPVAHSLGSLGTGDLCELAEIALALLGEGELWSGGERVPAPAPAAPPRLGLRDALGLISSNALTVGRSALACVDAQRLLARWLAVAALSFEAAGADPVVLDERLAEARGSEAQAAVAERVRSLLRPPGEVRQPPAGVRQQPVGARQPPRGSLARPGRDERPVQDPYPFRVLPQVDAVALGAHAALAALLAREAGARAENALIADGEALPNGNFHAAELAAALDALRAALAQSASLIAARVSALLDPRFTGLEPFLARRPGLESGAMMLEYAAAAAAAEVRSLALPVAVQSASASLGVESHASFAATALARLEQALAALEPLVATEFVVALRALRLAGRKPAGEGTARLYALAASALPASLEDRPLGPDVRTAAELLRDYEPR